MTSTHPILWLFGLPSAGKSTLAGGVRDAFESAGHRVVVLDGDDLRSGLCTDLGFTDHDRAENLRRAAEIAKLLARQGLAVVCAFITPKEQHRELVRSILRSDGILIHVDCPLDICVKRDVKGLYQKARASAISGMTGVQDSFDSPADCDLSINSHQLSIADAVEKIVGFIHFSA